LGTKGFCQVARAAVYNYLQKGTENRVADALSRRQQDTAELCAISSVLLIGYEQFNLAMKVTHLQLIYSPSFLLTVLLCQIILEKMGCSDINPGYG
jgi:hypothetical protein